MGSRSSRIKPYEPEFVSVYDNENEYSYDHTIDRKCSPIISGNSSLNSMLCNISIERQMITHG